MRFWGSWGVGIRSEKWQGARGPKANQALSTQSKYSGLYITGISYRGLSERGTRESNRGAERMVLNNSNN